MKDQETCLLAGCGGGGLRGCSLSGQAEVATRHIRRGADGRDPGALQRSASMCYSRENGWVKIKRQEGGCSPTGRIPSIPRVCREAGGQSHSTKA